MFNAIDNVRQNKHGHGDIVSLEFALYDTLTYKTYPSKEREDFDEKIIQDLIDLGQFLKQNNFCSIILKFDEDPTACSVLEELNYHSCLHDKCVALNIGTEVVLEAKMVQTWFGYKKKDDEQNVESFAHNFEEKDWNHETDYIFYYNKNETPASVIEWKNDLTSEDHIYGFVMIRDNLPQDVAVLLNDCCTKQEEIQKFETRPKCAFILIEKLNKHASPIHSMWKGRHQCTMVFQDHGMVVSYIGHN